MNKLFISIIRFLFDLAGPLIGPADRVVETSVITIENNLKLTIYTPVLETKKNVVLYYHGGGWIIGSIRAYDRILKYICCKAGCIVIGVEYRKAPEFKYPKAIEDAFTAYLWVLKNIIKDDTKAKISLIGDSAGGSLVISLINIIRQQHYRAPNLAVLIYPALGLSYQSLYYLKTRKPRLQNLFGYFALKYCLKQYLKNMKELESLNKGSLNLGSRADDDCPKILILMAQWDPLSIFIIKWKEEQLGNKQNITCITYPGTLHGFINFSRISKQAKTALDKIIDFLINADLS